MANPLYLAMTAAEILSCNELPPRVAWMACHFSPYGRGLSNLPKELPPGSMLILNDRIEPQGIDPQLVVQQLLQTVQALECGSVLLDFQRPGNEQTKAVAEAVCKALPCPLAVSDAYARDLGCAVFLPPPPLREDVAAYFSRWGGREVWLEVYEQWETLAIQKQCVELDTQPPVTAVDLPHYDAPCNCRYGMEVTKDRATFTLHRGMEQWQNSTCPITNLIALWQDYRP